MLDINNASVFDVLNAVRSEQNEKGIKRYSDNKMNEVHEILNEYAQKIEAPDELREIIIADIPAVMELSKSVSVEKWMDNMNEVSSFLAFTEETVEDQFENESWMYADNFYDDMPRDSDIEPNFSEIYSWSYVQKIVPEITKEQYDKIAKAWKDGDITSEVAYNAKFEITPEFEEQIQDAVNNKRKFSTIRNYLFNTELDWNDLSNGLDDEPKSLLAAVLDLDVGLIDACPAIRKYIDTASVQDAAIIKAMLDEAE